MEPFQILLTFINLFLERSDFGAGHIQLLLKLGNPLKAY